MQSEMQKMLKKATIKNNIQKELIEYVKANYEDYEAMWFEELEENFVSETAAKENIAFVFDENLNISILHM